MKPVFKAVIFDMDGVIVDSNATHLRAFQAIGQSIGVPFPESMLQRTFGMHNNQIFPLWLGENLSSEEIKNLSLRKEVLYRSFAEKSLQAIPGAIALAQSLSNAG